MCVFSKYKSHWHEYLEEKKWISHLILVHNIITSISIVSILSGCGIFMGGKPWQFVVYENYICFCYFIK